MSENSGLLGASNPSTKEEVNIKDLPSAANLSGSDAVILVQNSAYTKQTNLDDISTYMLKENNIPSLTTNHKDIVGAINEVKGVELFGTLHAGETSITFTDASIKTTSKVIPYVEVWGVAPKSIETYSGMVYMKFRKLDYDLNIQLVIQ